MRCFVCRFPPPQSVCARAARVRLAVRRGRAWRAPSWVYFPRTIGARSDDAKNRYQLVTKNDTMADGQDSMVEHDALQQMSATG